MRDAMNWSLTCFAVVISIVSVTQVCCSAERRERLGASSWCPRTVEPTELRDKRGDVEDRLRLKVLAAFFDDGNLKVLRSVLNAPWDRAGVEALGQIVLAGAPVNGEVTIIDPEWTAIAEMVAFVGKEYAQTPAGAAAKDTIERIMDRAITTDKRGVQHADFFGETASAIATYGTADHLTESFWKGIAEGRWNSTVLLAVGDERAITGTGHFKNTHLRALKNTHLIS